MPHKPHSYLASPEGLAERFNYPNTIPAVRVLDSRFVAGSRDVVHLVQLAPAGVAQPARWMDARAWRELVGMPQP